MRTYEAELMFKVRVCKLRPAKAFCQKYCIYKKIIDFVQCNTSRNNLVKRFPALELLCNSLCRVFLRRFRDPIRVPIIENRVPAVRKYYRVPRIRENRVPGIREIGSLQVHTGYLTFSLKNLAYVTSGKKSWEAPGFRW